LEADANSVGFSAGMVESDLAAFEAAIAENTSEALERAAALYRADLLDGFSLRDRDFDEWLTGERERLREHAVQLFLRLMKLAVATGAEPAIRWALRILAVDPVHEPAHRGLMELYGPRVGMPLLFANTNSYARFCRANLPPGRSQKPTRSRGGSATTAAVLRELFSSAHRPTAMAACRAKRSYCPYTASGSSKKNDFRPFAERIRQPQHRSQCLTSPRWPCSPSPT
jgi:hypothetical protein